MTRYALKAAVGLTGFFALALLLIRAQPYDDHDLRAVLLPEDCEMPCFLGIRLGVTTFQEALKVLQAHPWVGDIYLSDPVDERSFQVDWSGSQPAWMRGRALLQVQYGVVQDIYLGTAIPLGDLWLALGLPDSVHYGTTFVSGTFDYFYFFRDGLVQSQAVIACPVGVYELWNAAQGLHLVGWRTRHEGQITFNIVTQMNQAIC
jgi:hypothetical protein